MTLRHFDVAERRRRLLARHHLVEPLPMANGAIERVAGDLVGLHSSDPATVYLSAQQRVAGMTVTDLDDALYERRTLARIHGMRRTMFVAPLELAAVINAAATRPLIEPEHKRTLQLLAAEGFTDPAKTLEQATVATLKVIEAADDPVAARALTPAVAELQVQVSLAEGKAYAARPNITNRVLLGLSLDLRISRARPLGSWLSSQYRWTPWVRWFGAALPEIAAEQGRSELARRWLATYGPATTADLAWWAKWTKRETLAALAAVDAVEVTAEPAPGGDPVPAWVLPDALDDVAIAGDGPVVNLVPSLDPAIMGWKERAWTVGEHGPVLFDRNGNSGPIVLVDGAAEGAWSITANGGVVTELLRPADRRVQRAVDSAAAELTAWLDGVRVIPRFPNPLERRLAAR